MSTHTAGMRSAAGCCCGKSRHWKRAARASALNDSVKRVRGSGWNQSPSGPGYGSIRIDSGCRGQAVFGWIKIVSLVLSISHRAVEADSYAQVDRQARGSMPVILEVGLKNLIAQIVFGLTVRLAKTRDVAG